MLRFKTNAELKSIIGKDLINNDNIAIQELLKNAIDAGSDRTVIRFFSGGKCLLIKDNGSGMSLNDISEKWLNIAYSEKKENEIISNHQYAGSKGIGRFSCDRLGDHLELYTRINKREKFIKLAINWELFEGGSRSTTIESIPLSHEYVTEIPGVKNPPDTGTCLLIKGLRRSWGEKEIFELKSSLEKLLNPNIAFQVDSPEVHLISDEHNIRTEVKNTIFQKLDFKTTSITSELIDDGEIIKTTIFHKDQELVEIREKNPYPELKKLSSLKINLKYLNQYSKSYFKRQTGVRKVEFGSVFVFLNGFRIPPYGEIDNDSLGLEIRKGQGYARFLGGRDLLGTIEISDPKKILKVVSSREGLVLNKTFEAILHQNVSPDENGRYKGLFFDTLRRLESFVVKALEWEKIKEHSEKDIEDAVMEGTWSEDSEIFSLSEESLKQSIFEYLTSTLKSLKKDTEVKINEKYLNDYADDVLKYSPKLIENFLTEYRKNDRDGSGYVQKLEKKISTDEKIIKELKKEKEFILSHKTETETQLNYYRSIQSLDKNELIHFSHDIKVSSDAISGVINTFIHENKPEKNSEIASLLRAITQHNNKIRTISSFATKAGFNARGKPLETELISYISEYIKENHRGKYPRVKVDKSGIEFLKVISPIDIWIIFDNLISNSGKAKAKNVLITFSSAPDSLVIHYSDDGKGFSIKGDDLELIFEEGYTTTDGSGIGLHQVKNILKTRLNAEISAINTPAGSGARFEIRISKK